VATNDFQTFAGDPAADVLTQAAYIDPGFTARILGFSTGTALSIQLNKVWRQASIVSHMIGQFTVDEIGQDMLDDGTPGGLAALEAHFRAAVVHVAQSSIGTNFLPLTGGTLTGPLQINASTFGITATAGTWAQISLSRQQGQGAQLLGYTGTLLRWATVFADNAPEQGSNSGSNFTIARYSDAGTYLDAPLAINRATGVVNFSHPPTVNGALLPYVPLAGGVMSGTLGVGSTGIAFPGLGGYWGQHHLAFGWDGSFVEMAVDGTGVGAIATTGYVGGVAGNYLPLAGGTITGGLVVNSSLTVYGNTWNAGTTYFANLGDFVNNWDGRYRYRQWAGNWYDYWDGATGTRGWGQNGYWMTLDFQGNLSNSGTYRSNAGRILSIAGAYSPSVCAYWTGGVAVGFWADGSGLWLGNMDGSANPSSGHMLVDNNGYITMYGSTTTAGWAQVNGSINCNGTVYSQSGVFYQNLTVDDTLFVNNNVSVAGTVYANANLWAAGWLYASSGNGAYVTNDGIVYQGRGPAYNIAFMFDGTTFWRFCNGDQREVIQGDNSQRVRQLGMSGVTMHWIDSDGSGWFANTYRSDARFKRNIREAEDFDSLAAIVATPIRAFEWREDYNMPPVPYGLISTDIRQTLPDAVMEAVSDEAVDPVDHIDPMAMFAHLFRAIQQLEARISSVGA
jgi:hypothetical protein